MEPMDFSNPDFGNEDLPEPEDNAAEIEGLRLHVDGVIMKVDELEQRVNKVEQFYSTANKKHMTTSKSSSIGKEKEREKHLISIKKSQQDAPRQEAAATKRMQELMRQFATILRQLSQHKLAWPFLDPVDVKGLGLHDYYEIIERPMDFSTIKNKMEAKDGSGYKNVREICADTRLVFKNAMKYNDQGTDVHEMAKILLEKFEEKWLLLLSKVVDEEKRHEEEGADAQSEIQLTQEAIHAKMAGEISDELEEIDMHLEELREMVIQKSRNMSAAEKNRIGDALMKLPREDLQKALQIFAEDNPSFSWTAPVIDLHIDAQSESTLWRLKFFVKNALEAEMKRSQRVVNNKNRKNSNNINTDNAKRKREICNALAKTAKKRSKKLNS